MKLRKITFLVLLASTMILVGAVLQVQQTMAQVEEPLFTLYYLCASENPSEIEVGEILKETFAEAGIELIVETVDTNTYWSRTISQIGPTMLTHEEGGYDITYMTYIQIPSDMIWYPGCFMSKGIPPLGWNFWAYKNGIYDDELRAAMSTYDMDERLEHIYKWQDINHEDVPVVFLLHSTLPYMCKRAIKGYDPTLVNYDIDEWTVDGYTADDDVTITEAIGWDVPMWNPLFLDGGYLLLDPLFRTMWRCVYDENVGYTTAPELAYDYDISEDGLTMDFFLNDNIYWHDGEQLTAEDVVFTYECILDPDTGATFHTDFSEAVASAEVIDEFTVRLHLAKRSPEIFTLLGTYNTAILPEHVLGDIAHEDLRTHTTNTEAPPPGCGPFVFKEWVRGQFIKFDVNENYFKERPFVDHLVLSIIPEASTQLAALEAGEVDLTEPYTARDVLADVPRVRDEHPELNMDLYTRAEYTFLPLNNDHPILANKFVRQAIAYLVPAQRIIDEVFDGYAVPSSSFVAPNFWWFDPDTPYYEYNVAKAKELLMKAGYPEWPPEAEEVTIPMSAYYLPLAGGAIIGLVIGAVAVYALMGRRD